MKDTGYSSLSSLTELPLALGRWVPLSICGLLSQLLFRAAFLASPL
jgi:hypothetical protein